MGGASVGARHRQAAALIPFSLRVLASYSYLSLLIQLDIGPSILTFQSQFLTKPDYEGFYKAEKGSGMAVQRIVELLGLYPEIVVQLYFIKESCQRLIMVHTALEAINTLLACKVYNYMEDLRMHLRAGIRKPTLGTETDWLYRPAVCLLFCFSHLRAVNNLSGYMQSHM